MKIHAVIDTKTLELLLVTDDVEDAYKEIERLKCRRSDGEARYAVLDSDSVRLSPSAMTCASMEYDMACLEKKVRNRLHEREINEHSASLDFQKLIDRITGDAYYNMTCCGDSESIAIDSAIERYFRKAQRAVLK